MQIFNCSIVRRDRDINLPTCAVYLGELTFYFLAKNIYSAPAEVQIVNLFFSNSKKGCALMIQLFILLALFSLDYTYLHTVSTISYNSQDNSKI